MWIGTGVTFGQATNPPAIQLSAQQQQVFNKMFFASAGCIQQIDEVVGHLAMLLNNHHIKGLPNPDRIKRILIEYRQLLGGLLQAMQTDLDPVSQIKCIDVFLKVSDEFITLLEHGLKSNLKNLKEFDINALAKKRSAMSNMSPEKLQQTIEATHKRIQKLKQKANSAGLTWYNKVARSIDKHFVTRWNKYHCTSITKTVGGAAIFSLYALWQYGKYSKYLKDTSLYGTLVQYGGNLQRLHKMAQWCIIYLKIKRLRLLLHQRLHIISCS